MKKPLLSRCCCLGIIITLINNNITAIANTDYYYQNTKISTINHPKKRISFLLIGQERLLALSKESSDSLASQSSEKIQNTTIIPVYFLGDGKSQDIQIPQKTSSIAVLWDIQNAYQSTDYYGYGRKSTKSNLNSITDFGYNTEYQDPSTQLIYLSARDYNASTQRFITMDSDPLPNRYASFNSDPINHIDPSGHSAKQWLKSNASWLVPVGLLSLSALAFGIYKYRNRPMTFEARNKTWAALPESVILSKTDIENQGKQLGSGEFGTAYLMEKGDYQGIVFKIIHEDQKGGVLSDPARNVRYLNQANGESDFAKVATLNSGEAIQITRYVKGSIYEANTSRGMFLASSRAQFRINNVDILDILAPGNVIVDSESRYWLIDADNAMSNYRDRSNSEGSELLWDHLVQNGWPPTQEGWLP